MQPDLGFYFKVEYRFLKRKMPEIKDIHIQCRTV